MIVIIWWLNLKDVYPQYIIIIIIIIAGHSSGVV
jgi:hypothetical protein